MGNYSNADFINRIERKRAKQKQKNTFSRYERIKEEIAWSKKYVLSSEENKLLMREKKNNQKLERFL